MKTEILKLIEENKNLIYSIASKYSMNYSIEDLFQVGVIGLIDAYKHYKKDSQSKFSTYAFQYIRGSIIEYIKKDRNIKVSENYLKLYKSYIKARELLIHKLNKEPSIREISVFLNVDESILSEAINASTFTTSLDSNIDEENSITCLDTYGIDYRDQIDNLLDVKNALNNLTEEEQKLIEYRYYQDYTQSETAELLGISQVQVSRNEKLVLSKMRKSIVV